jgi:hypothetical protein
MWSAQIHDTQSGDRLGGVDVVAGPWGRGDRVTRQATIRLDKRRKQAGWRNLIQGVSFWDRTLVYLWDGVPVYAGLIIGAPTWRPGANLLTVEHVDLSILLERRWMHGVGPSTGGGGYVPAGSFSVSGVSLRGALRAILYRAYLDLISPAWPVPVDLPGSESGSFSKTWYFYEFQSAADMVSEITNREDGPDLDLRPYLTSAGKLRWDQRIGTPYTGGPGHKIMLSAAKSSATAWGLGSDGTNTTTGIHFPGKGSEQDMRVGSAAAPVSAGLARDSIFTDKNDDSVSSLSAKARGRLGALGSPVELWPVSVHTSKISPTGLQVGSVVDTHTYGDLWAPDGWKSHRVAGFSGQYGAETFELSLES